MQILDSFSERYQKFDIVAFPKHDQANGSRSPRLGRALLKKQLSYAENDKDSVIVSLKVHVGSMLEYNQMSTWFSKADCFEQFCNMVTETYQGIVVQEFANVNVAELQQQNPSLQYDSKIQRFSVTKVYKHSLTL